MVPTESILIMEKEAILKAEPNTVVIRPTKGWMSLNLRDLWHYRERIWIGFVILWERL